MKRFFDALLRRNVFRVAFAYIVVAWLVVQIVNNLVPLLDVPEWVGRAIFIFIVAAFPIALIIAWAFELTPQGLRRTPDIDSSSTPRTRQAFGRRWDFAIIAGLAVALGYSLWSRPEATGGNATQASIAVLPFANFSSDPEQEYFSDGLSEELLNRLANLEGLRVAGRTSSFAFKGKDTDLRTIGEMLGVAHILEGSVRKSGDGRIRITAQLINTADGYHLWSRADRVAVLAGHRERRRRPIDQRRDVRASRRSRRRDRGAAWPVERRLARRHHPEHRRRIMGSYYGDPELALRALTLVPVDGFSQAIADTLWRPLMSDMRRLPGFEQLVQQMGLVDYWRAYAWPDYCRPLPDGAFECR